MYRASLTQLLLTKILGPVARLPDVLVQRRPLIIPKDDYRLQTFQKETKTKDFRSQDTVVSASYSRLALQCKSYYLALDF